MAAYVIVDVKINDAVDYEEYKKLTPTSIAAYDGSFIVRVVKPKFWKVIGPRAELLYYNSQMLTARSNGGPQPNMQLPNL